MNYKTCIILVLIVVLVIMMAAAAFAQADSNRKFIRIVHSSEGTMAVDSLGEVWYYDEESGDFIRAAQYREMRSEGSGGHDGDERPADLSPEERCTNVTYGEVSDLFDEIEIGLDERIEGSVICGKNVTVMGLVTGDVFSFQTVTVTNTGEVRGNVIARKIRKESRGVILGTRSEVPVPRLPGVEFKNHLGIMPGFVTIFVTLLIIFLCLIVLALFPDPARRIGEKLEQKVIASFFWGLLTWFALAPLFVLLCITIVGIPVALLVYPLAIVATIILGYTAVACYIGNGLAQYLGWQNKSRYIKGLIGVLLLEIWRAISIFFFILGADALGNLFLVIFIVINSVALTAGIGAVVSARFGRKPKEPHVEITPSGTPPSPPAMPKSPRTTAPPVPMPPDLPPPPPPPGSKNATD